MTNNKLILKGNNGEERVSARILITDMPSYDMVIAYLAGEAVKTEESQEDILRGKTNYSFGGGGIAKANKLRRIVELEEVKLEIKNEIEKIVMRYSE